jgi:hypothetical protein
MTRSKLQSLVWYVNEIISYITNFVSSSDISRSSLVQPQELLDYTGYSRDLILSTADFVATKVGESVKTKADRVLVAVRRKYSSGRYCHVSSYFVSPDAVDILDDHN